MSSLIYVILHLKAVIPKPELKSEVIDEITIPEPIAVKPDYSLAEVVGVIQNQPSADTNLHVGKYGVTPYFRCI